MQLGLRPRLRSKNSLWDLIHKHKHLEHRENYHNEEREIFSEKSGSGSWGIGKSLESLPPLPISPAPSVKANLQASDLSAVSIPLIKVKMAPVRPNLIPGYVCVFKKEADWYCPRACRTVEERKEAIQEAG